MIRHLLAYGQSDQASFRDRDVAGTYDTMTVPGTIASYFADATAGFVLSIRKPYLIDPRTPLFQATLNAPRASHLTLGAWHGASVEAEIQTAPAHFPASFYTRAVVSEMVEGVVSQQRDYGARAAGIAPKMDRYKLLLAQARGEDPTTTGGATPGAAPESILLPYFAINSLSSPWWNVMQEVWRHSSTLTDPGSLRPVICVGAQPGESLTDGIDLLDAVIAQRPTALSPELLFWITSCDERLADFTSLRRLWTVIQDRSKAGVTLTNLYGGFFSICLGIAGLAGFGNGLAYSESRAWPALDSTGAAPARYYVRAVHAFAPPAAADQLVTLQPRFRCDCLVCTRVRAVGRSIVSMDYAELKAHFALARLWEMELVDRESVIGVARHLRSSLSDYQATALPPGVRIATAHLKTWALVLEDVASP